MLQAKKGLHGCLGASNRHAAQGALGCVRDRCAGFTLMEMLIVVALLAIMVAIAAPNLLPIVRSTEITRLDNYAKEIYVAAQNQFVGMEPAGEYKQFNATVREATERNLGALRAQPSDSIGSDWYNFYYLTSYDTGRNDAQGAADNAFAQVMNRTSALEGIIGNGRYIVEVNPRTDGTDVYAVFYSEDPDFTYEDVMALASRNQEDRMNTGRGYPLGYYCATSSDSGDVPDHFTPRARFVNGEELFLNVSCPGALAFVGAESGMRVTMTITDGNAAEVLEYIGGRDFRLDVNGNVDFDLLLDSMRPGLSLADILPTFEPGADLRVSVDVTFTGNDGTTIVTPAQLRAQARANSLFASNTDGIIEVANVRHLRNLALLPSNVLSVSQVADIDFDARSWVRSDFTQLSRSTKDYNDTEYAEEFVNPLDPRTDPSFAGFAPIEPDDNASWAFDGKGNKLSNFFIRGNGSSGLFAHVRAGQTISNVTLVDAVVEGGSATGALVGTLEGRIVSCGAHLDVASGEDSFKQSTCLVISDGSDPVGGLVGEAVGSASVESSYAAVDVAGPSSPAVGGLVGSISGGAVSQCYSSGIVDAQGAAGGLIGSARDVSVQGCYTTSDIDSASTAGGFVGEIADSSVHECISYGLVSPAGSGGFVGAWSNTEFSSCAYLSLRSYNEGLSAQPDSVVAQGLGALVAPRLGADHSHSYRESLMGQAFPFAAVLDDHWGNWPLPATVRPTMLYYERYGDGSYGYYGTGYDETGDIPLNTLDETLVVVEDGYALLCSNEIAGFDYALNGGETYRARLGTGTDAGTFVELPTESQPANYASESEDDAYEEETSSYLFYWADDNLIPLEGFHVYRLPVDLLMPSRNASSVYDALQVQLAEEDGQGSTEYLFYYNPDLAKMAVSPNAAGETPAPSDPADLLVRTARQLNRIGYEPYYWSSSIKQDRDIDFGYYTANYAGIDVDFSRTSGEYANHPIGLLGRPFSGTFDGQNYAIIDYLLDASALAASGLFGCVSGTVQNVHLAASKLHSAYVTRSGSLDGSLPCVGALAGWVDGGVVRGCSVSGYRVSFGCTGNLDACAAGGLVGVNQGSVVHSSAANVDVSVSASSSSGAQIGAGGLVGANGAAVLSCYAVENDLSIRTSTSGSGRTVDYGGIVGTPLGNGSSVGNSYAWLYARNTACSDDDSISYYAIANTSLTDVYRCCCLEVDEPFEDDDAVVRCNPAELQNYELADFVNATTPRFTYGETMSGHVVQQAANYPYPVVCRDAYGDYAHYGFDWRE